MSEPVLFSEKNPKCFICGKPIEEGPVVAMLFTDAYKAEEAIPDAEIEVGDMLIGFDWDDEVVAHADCVRNANVRR